MNNYDMDCEWDDQFSAITLAVYSGVHTDDRENCRPEDPMLRNLLHVTESCVSFGASAFGCVQKRKLSTPTPPLNEGFFVFPPQPPTVSHLSKKTRIVSAGTNFNAACNINSRNMVPM
uniref:Uncharacterized protein n=1 Tax=Spumella elongata TaxID=89044 RepID=A0A7S3GMW2_9STRA|mmetsp:Transcript_10243/g.17793  ORF Transcript_10243/g.17793 Transcript_10243/m.17793 type:complete len:118 (+) Transcript_10243:93-446(+)